jgi:hypothetical protein
MPDLALIKEIEDFIRAQNEMSEFLDSLLVHPDFATLSNKPAIKLTQTASKFAASNLEQMLVLYRIRTEV